MPRAKLPKDPSILAMALVGYEMEKKRIDERIREIRDSIGGEKPAKKPVALGGANEHPKKRTLSLSARRRIAAAQRRRWAAHRKQLAQAAKKG